MTDAELDLIVDPNAVFTVIVNLMWHLHALATERAPPDSPPSPRLLTGAPST